MQQIAKNIRNSMSYLQLLERIKDWNVEFRLKEKYYSWSLKCSLPKIIPTFYQLVQQNLITYTLKNFSWILNDFQQHLVGIHEKKMKLAYSSMSLGNSISSQTFNFSMIVLVKLTAYFLCNHISVIQIDMILECDVYRQAMFNILGIQIQKNTYQIILKMYKSKKEMSKERQSLNLDKDDKENSLHTFNKMQTIKSIGRRNGKHQTYHNHMVDLQDERARLQQIKYLLKSNLYVKPNPKRVQTKYTITQLKQKQKQHQYIINREYSSLASIRVGHFKNKSMQTPRGKFIIQSNQLSNAFSSSYEVKLNQIKKHSIHLSHNKNLPINIKPKQLKKLQIKRTQTNMQDKKGIKSVKNWVKIVTEMKDQLYSHSRSNRISEDSNLVPQIGDQYYQASSKNKAKNSQQSLQSYENQEINEEIIKFRKLDLMNSPNIIVYDDYPLDTEEPILAKLGFLKPQMKLNRSQSKKKKGRISDPHKSNE